MDIFEVIRMMFASFIDCLSSMKVIEGVSLFSVIISVATGIIVLKTFGFRFRD